MEKELILEVKLSKSVEESIKTIEYLSSLSYETLDDEVKRLICKFIKVKIIPHLQQANNISEFIDELVQLTKTLDEFRNNFKRNIVETLDDFTVIDELFLGYIYLKGNGVPTKPFERRTETQRRKQLVEEFDKCPEMETVIFNCLRDLASSVVLTELLFENFSFRERKDLFASLNWKRSYIAVHTKENVKVKRALKREAAFSVFKRFRTELGLIIPYPFIFTGGLS